MVTAKVQPRVCETCVSRKPRGPVKYWYRTGDFNRHLKTHLKDKPYKCEYCGKAFVQQSALKTHTNTHTGAKPYICGVGKCKKRFSDPSSCSRHKRETHSNDDGYACCEKDCSTHIRRKSLFVKHIQEKHGWTPTMADLKAMLIPKGRLSMIKSDSDDEGESSSHGSDTPSAYSSPTPMTTSLSPSPGPDGVSQDMYAMPYGSGDEPGIYDYAHLSAVSHRSMTWPVYSAPRMAEDGHLNGMFGHISMYETTPYDDGLGFDASSSSSPSSETSNMVNWDVDVSMPSYAAERGLSTITSTLYDC